LRPLPKQASWIKGEIDKFKGVSMVWVSNEQLNELATFSKKHFDGKSNFIFCQDDQFMFDQYFGFSEVLSVRVYNKKREMRATFNDFMPVSQLLKALD